MKIKDFSETKQKKRNQRFMLRDKESYDSVTMQGDMTHTHSKIRSLVILTSSRITYRLISDLEGLHTMTNMHE